MWAKRLASVGMCVAMCVAMSHGAVAGCDDCDETVACEATEFASCSYQGCADWDCSLAASQGTRVCLEDGSFSCSVWPEVEPECDGGGVLRERADCSAALLAVLTAGAPEDEAVCRAAFEGLWDCMPKDVDAWNPETRAACESEIEVLDRACFSSAPPNACTGGL